MSRRTVRPHLFTPDPDVPPGQDGRGACSTCHLIGAPGDRRHTLPDAPQDVRQLAAGDHQDEGERRWE